MAATRIEFVCDDITDASAWRVYDETGYGRDYPTYDQAEAAAGLAPRPQYDRRPDQRSLYAMRDGRWTR